MTAAKSTPATSVSALLRTRCTIFSKACRHWRRHFKGSECIFIGEHAVAVVVTATVTVTITVTITVLVASSPFVKAIAACQRAGPIWLGGKKWEEEKSEQLHSPAASSQRGLGAIRELLKNFIEFLLEY